MKVLFLSQSSRGFASLRSRHIRSFLQTQPNVISHELPLTEKSISDAKTHAQLYALSTHCDAIVTAGPFLPALMIPYLNTKTPLWIDWPSDPLADGLAKSSTKTSMNWTEIHNATHLALARADAFGVISQRSKDALIGELMFLGRADATLYSQCIHVTPIVYEFPEPQNSPSLQKNRFPIDSFDILLCGSINTWFDVQNLCDGLEIFLEQNKSPVHVHIVGAKEFCSYTSEGFQYIQNWKHQLPQIYRNHIHSYEWLENDDFYSILQKCHVGLWMDKEGVEPYLGSRTRALFYAWNGLDIIGGGNCELSQDLVQHREMYTASSAEELATTLLYISEHPLSLEQNQKRHVRLQTRYGLDTVFRPLASWLMQPTSQKHSIHVMSAQSQIAKLQQELQDIYSSPTWKVMSSIHKKLRFIKSKIQR